MMDCMLYLKKNSFLRDSTLPLFQIRFLLKSYSLISAFATRSFKKKWPHAFALLDENTFKKEANTPEQTYPFYSSLFNYDTLPFKLHNFI